MTKSWWCGRRWPRRRRGGRGRTRPSAKGGANRSPPLNREWRQDQVQGAQNINRPFDQPTAVGETSHARPPTKNTRIKAANILALPRGSRQHHICAKPQPRKRGVKPIHAVHGRVDRYGSRIGRRPKSVTPNSMISPDGIRRVADAVSAGLQSEGGARPASGYMPSVSARSSGTWAVKTFVFMATFVIDN